MTSMKTRKKQSLDKVAEFSQSKYFKKDSVITHHPGSFTYCRGMSSVFFLPLFSSMECSYSRLISSRLPPRPRGKRNRRSQWRMLTWLRWSRNGTWEGHEQCPKWRFLALRTIFQQSYQHDALFQGTVAGSSGNQKEEFLLWFTLYFKSL